MNTATRAPLFLRILAVLVIAFLADSPVYSQFTPAEPPPMAPAEFAPDYVDQTWKWSIRTDTLPGWLYSVEESADLATWTLIPNSYFYGNGTQLKCFICNGPPPPAEAAPTNGNGTGTGGWSWQVHHFSLTLRMQEGGASSSYFLQRESADPDSPNAWQTNLTEPLPPQVPGTRNFSMLEWSDPTTHLLYWVDVHVIISTDPPPSADPAHPPIAADLAIFQHIKPQLLARLLTPDDPNAPSNTPSNSKFARVRRTAIDSNGNGYPDWYEIENFAPGSAFAPAGSALYVTGEMDQDGDGFTAAEEAAGRTSDTDPNSHPPAFTRLVTLRKSSKFFSDATTVATRTDYIGWPVLLNYVEFPFPIGMILKLGTHTTNVGVATTPQLLRARVLSELRPFPGTPANSSYLRSVIVPVTATGTFQHTPMTPDRLPRQQAEVENVSVWLEHKPIETEPVSVTFLVVPRTRAGVPGAPLTGPWTTGQIQTVTLTVPAKQTGEPGHTLSETKQVLVPEFTAPPATGAYNLEAEVRLLPLEILDNNKNPISKLKVAKMSEEGVLSATGTTSTLDIEKDSDRIYVSLKGGAALGKISVEVGTSDNPDWHYDDGATIVELSDDGSNAISKSMLLVSDEVDDAFPVDGIADNLTGDRTRLVQLGGNFQIGHIKIGTEPWIDIDAKFPVPVIKKLKCDVFLLKVGGAAVRDIGEVRNAMKLAQERFAQVGVQIEYMPIMERDVPAGVDMSDGVTVTATNGGQTLSAEAKTFLDGLATVGPTKDVQIFFVDAAKNGGANVKGIAVADFAFDASEDSYLYNIFVSNIGRPFTAAHEIGHLLTDRGHEGDSFNLMKEFTDIANTLSATKRFDILQESLIRQSDRLTNP